MPRIAISRTARMRGSVRLHVIRAPGNEPIYSWWQRPLRAAAFWLIERTAGRYAPVTEELPTWQEYSTAARGSRPASTTTDCE